MKDYLGLDEIIWAQAPRHLNLEMIMHTFVARCITIIALLPAGCSTGASSDLKRGWELMLAKDYSAARDVYEGIIVEHPENPYAHLNLGVAYQYLGKSDLARLHYEAAIANGGSAEVTRVVEEGAVIERVSTVADKAMENLLTLPN